jgi:hypothetical protein
MFTSRPQLLTSLGALVLTAATAAVCAFPNSTVAASHGDTGEHVAVGNDAHATRAAGGPALTLTSSRRPPLSAQAHRRSHSVPTGERSIRRPSDPASEVQNEENSNGYSTRLLTSRGGAVQTSPRIYLVFWGANWFTGGDPYGVANRLHTFYSGLSGSTMNNVMKEYAGSNGRFTNPAGQYKGWLQDTTALPANPTQSQMAQAAVRAANRVNDHGYNAQFVIATPNNVVDQYTLNQRACAWHNWTYAGSSWITYTSLPYTPYMDQRVGCGGGKVNGANGRLDGVTINALHEYAETVNDPGLNAWADSDGSENADKCSWVNLRNYKLTNGYSLPVQPTWSNSFKKTYGYGCYYS